MFRKMLRKPLVQINAGAAERYRVLAAHLFWSGRGAEFRVQDVWLAAQCLQRDFTLLTSNAKDFRDIPALKFIEVILP
jgi:predicted nucleic acid-binding protein